MAEKKPYTQMEEDLYRWRVDHAPKMGWDEQQKLEYKIRKIQREEENKKYDTIHWREQAELAKFEDRW